MQASSTSYQKIIQLIRRTNTEQVNQAQSALQQFAINDPNLLLYLTQILKDNTIEESTKLAASIYMNHLFSQNSRNFNKQQLLYQLITILQDVNIDGKFKRTLQRGIINIIDQLQQPYITQLRQLIFTLIKQQKLRDTAYLLIACFCIPQTIDMQHIIYLTRNFLPLSLSKIILPNTKQSIYIAKQYNQILKTWIVAWDKLVKQYQQYLAEKKKSLRNNKKNKIKQPNFQSINLLLQLTQSQQLTSVILSIYPWMCQSPMYICTQYNLQQLNILKQQAAALHYRMLKICNKKSHTQNIIFNSTTLIIPNIINNLIVIVNNHNILDQYLCRDYIVNMIKILTQYFLCKPNTFSKDWKQLLSTIIFPLIKPNDQQHDMFINNPTQFVSIFEDSTEKQTYGILKTQICRLLQKIGDKSQILSQAQFVIDFIVNFCVDSVKNYFKVPVQNVYSIEYVGLDVAITAISIFSYRLQKHKNKIWQLQSFLNKQFVYALNPYDRTMFYLFLSYNYGQLYPNPIQGSFWIQIALQQNSHETTKYCANDFIFNIADQYYSDYFVQCLGNKILTNQQANIWDSIQKLLQTQITKISSALMIQLMSNLYTRFEQQIQKISNQSKQQIKQTITLLKILQILKTIAQNDTYCKENPNIREMLWKIMLIFDKAVQLKIQDQIFMIVQALIKQQDVISQTSKQVLVLILNQFAKDQIINQYIMKSTSQIILPILKCLQTAMIYHALSMGQSMRKSQRRLINSHLLLLLQNLLAIHGKILTSQQIIQITAVVIRYIPNQNQKIDCGVVLARALNVLILCHMFVKTDNTWYYIKKYVCKQIYHNYDIVVLIACIKAEIGKQTNVNIIAEMIVIIADAIKLFRKREKLDQTAQKIKAKYGKDNRLKLVKYKEFQQILKYIQTPFKMQNQQNKLQVELANLLQSLKQANKDLYNMMFSYIPEEKACQICELCQLPQAVMYNKRPKFTVLKPKAPELDEMKNSENEDDEGDFKRKRIENKKKNKDNSKKTIME